MSNVLGLAAHLSRGMQRVVTGAAIGRLGSLPPSINDLALRLSLAS